MRKARFSENVLPLVRSGPSFGVFSSEEQFHRRSVRMAWHVVTARAAARSSSGMIPEGGAAPGACEGANDRAEDPVSGGSGAVAAAADRHSDAWRADKPPRTRASRQAAPSHLAGLTCRIALEHYSHALVKHVFIKGDFNARQKSPIVCGQTLRFFYAYFYSSTSTLHLKNGIIIRIRTERHKPVT